jgi:hypothetical protein
MRNLGPELVFRRVNQPETAAVRANQIPGKIGVQADQFRNILFAADAGRMFKNGADGLLGLTAHNPCVGTHGLAFLDCSVPAGPRGDRYLKWSGEDFLRNSRIAACSADAAEFQKSRECSLIGSDQNAGSFEAIILFALQSAL